VPIPKLGGGTRWLTRLDPAGEAAYRRALGPVAGRIERSLGPEALAVRARPSAEGWRLRPWRPARDRWRAALRAVTEHPTRGTVFAVADVRECYASITPTVLRALLGPAVEPAVDILRRLRDVGIRGLPVGPEPSAILANAVLTELDGALRSTGARHVRWVDDVVLWGSGGEVRRALATLRVATTTVGLELHERKTRLLVDRDELRVCALAERDSSIIAAP
jgi:hypothetical protein